jgi:hypothetical protein
VPQSDRIDDEKYDGRHILDKLLDARLDEVYIGIDATTRRFISFSWYSLLS